MYSSRSSQTEQALPERSPTLVRSQSVYDLEVRHVSKKFGSLTILKDANFSVQRVNLLPLWGLVAVAKLPFFGS